jgi:RNA polymerase sigma-32 factor
VLRNWRLVKIATTKAQRKLFFNLRKYKKHLGWLSETERQALANDLGVSREEVVEMEKRLTSRDLSFDPLPDADEEDAPYTPSSYLPNPDADPAKFIEDEQWEESTAERLSAAMNSLDDRSKSILRSRWMTDDKATLHELAEKHGVSAERIRQIEVNAIKKLRGLLTEPVPA